MFILHFFIYVDVVMNGKYFVKRCNHNGTWGKVTSGPTPFRFVFQSWNPFVLLTFLSMSSTAHFFQLAFRSLSNVFFI